MDESRGGKIPKQQLAIIASTRKDATGLRMKLNYIWLLIVPCIT